MTSLLLSSVVALKCRAHFIAEHICASQQNSLDPNCWDLCNLVGFGPSEGVRRKQEPREDDVDRLAHPCDGRFRRRWPSAGVGHSRATSLLRSPERDVAFGAKNIGVEIGNPLPAVRRDVEIANGGSNVWRHAVPVELRILVDEVGGVVVAELTVEARFLELVIERVGLAYIVRIVELPDQVGGPQQCGLLVDAFYVRRHAAWEA